MSFTDPCPFCLSTLFFIRSLTFLFTTVYNKSFARKTVGINHKEFLQTMHDGFEEKIVVTHVVYQGNYIS